ncbi:MAG: histidine kinase dimerization/phosphoacceptor domain -containing protein [Chloroflexia bacterium]
MAPHLPPVADIALNLGQALIASSDAPLLLLDRELIVIAASKSFCRAFQIDPVSAPGRHLIELGAGEWNIPQLSGLLKAAAAGYAEVQGYEMELRRNGLENRCLLINAHKLEYTDSAEIRLLLAVSDVTDARLAEKIKDDLLRDRDNLLKEKAVLLQELQHRVANSLQIIASVLMQSARKVQSEEAKSHLVDAHTRVMSVASLQRQLAATNFGDVELRPYFTALCDSIGASMIRDHNQISLAVTVDESSTSADASVSLGLIVTELVINALKHAFPNDRKGKIAVDYHSRGPNWTLSVNDDGVGMSTKAEVAKPGLGTSIVQALAQQLHAEIKVSDTNPGTAVSVAHTHIAVVHGKPEAVPVERAV